MSGALAAAAVGAATIAMDFGGIDQPVSLGDFIFDGFEVPASITWGGSQAMTVHKLVGGTRIIDTMGPDDADISWSGIFLSSDASQRADQLNEMRRQGALLELIFADRYYLVVINSFRAETRMISHVPYSIAVTVLDDLSATVAPVTPISAVNDDLASALAYAPTPDLMVAAGALALVPPLLAPIAVLSPGAAATLAVSAALATTAGAISVAATAAGDAIEGIAVAALAAGTLAGAATAEGAMAAMAAADAATATAATAAVMGAYVGRARVNVDQA